MTNLTAKEEWSDVYQIEIHDTATGGANGTVNKAPQALANRTEFLKNKKADRADLTNLSSDLNQKITTLDNKIGIGQGGKFGFETVDKFYAEQADIPINSTVTIATGTDAGDYTWDGFTLTKSEYDPFNQAKKYSDSQDHIQNKNLSNQNAVSLNGINKTLEEKFSPVVVDQKGKIILGYNNIKDQLFANNILDDMTSNSAGVKGYDESLNPHVIPIVTDILGNILIGYSTLQQRLIISDTVDSETAAAVGLKAYAAESDILPIATGINGEILIGFSKSTQKIIGEFETATTSLNKTIPFPYDLIKADWNQSITYGQSLSDGAQGYPPISTTQPYQNLTYTGGVRSRDGTGITTSKPLIEENVETVTAGFANYAVKRAIVKDSITPDQHKIFGSACGAGGYRIDMLSKGSTWYNNQFLPHIRGAKAINANTTIQCINWLQGEANSGDGNPVYTSRADYKTALQQLVNDINAEAVNVTNQNTPVIFLCYQHSTYAKINNGGTQLGTLDLCAEDDRVYFVAPTYAFPHHSDNLHLINIGYKWLGAYFGRAYHQMMFEKIKPLSIKPLSATYQSNVIEVNFEVPCAPLQFNTAILAETTNFGFCIKMQNGTEIVISSVFIKNGTTVVINCAENITENVLVRYALDYNSMNLKQGATGNLFDSCTETVTINNIEKPMFYICPHFQITAFNGVI